MVTGIQQVGIGVSDITSSWRWYRTWFGFDVPVFDDEAEAKLMTRYTGGEVHLRRAVLAMNMQGGGGFEIWQYKSRKPEPASFPLLPGDFGINVVKLKSTNIKHSYAMMKNEVSIALSEPSLTPDGTPTFYIKDENGNIFQFVESESWFNLRRKHCGGVCGVVIGVSDMDKSVVFYKTLLGSSTVVHDITDGWEGMFGNDNTACRYRRVLLRKKFVPKGAFSELLGHIDVELVECHGRPLNKIYEGRYWGDLGFIHVCMDVFNMDELKKNLVSSGYNFTVDSSKSFDMGEAAGRFTYAEDPDGTLIEFVETHRVPILKKWNLYLNIKNRKENRPLPRWIVQCLSLNRIKD